MDVKKTEKLCSFIFKNVFGSGNCGNLKEIQEKFAIDIPRPVLKKCSLSGVETWSFSSEGEKIVSQKAVLQKYQENEWMLKKRKFDSIEDILVAWQEINYILGEKYLNSSDIFGSDGIYNSSEVYKSVSIFDSKKIIFCYKLFDCSYMLACRDNSACNLGIRVKESIYCSSCFEVSWSNKVSQSMFIHNGFDLYECLFCSHLRSKKYCIANIQFTKEEYFKIKPQVLQWILIG